MDKSDLFYAMLKDVKSTQEKMGDTLEIIKADLAYHIYRTDLLEKKVMWDWKKIAAACAAVASLATAAYYLSKVLI